MSVYAEEDFPPVDLYPELHVGMLQVDPPAQFGAYSRADACRQLLRGQPKTPVAPSAAHRKSGCRRICVALTEQPHRRGFSRRS